MKKVVAAIQLIGFFIPLVFVSFLSNVHVVN